MRPGRVLKELKVDLLASFLYLGDMKKWRIVRKHLWGKGRGEVVKIATC